jgi:hypothetical protein
MASDNHNTESAVSREFLTDSKGHHVHCFAHTLDLAVDDAFEDVVEAKTLLADCHDILAAFAARRVWGDKLEKAQRDAGVKTPLNLIQDCDTRWNSVCIMMGR